MNTRKDIEIASLLEKFYAGETTLREERQLKAYFKGENVPEDLKAEQSYFEYLLDAKMEGAQRRPIQFIESKPPKVRLLWHKPLLVAASLALLLSLGTAGYKIWDNSQQRILVLQDQEDVSLAYDETKKALLMISGQLRKGGESAQELKRLDKVMTDIKHNN